VSANVAWALLLVAGVCESFMAYSLGQSQGFTRLVWVGAFAVAGAISFGLLAFSLRELPVGTAYAVWTGIGAAGTALLGIVFLGESRELGKLLSLALIIAGVAGLKLVGGEH
jgi:quaternary ammonium compound-resistance protein SugE